MTRLRASLPAALRIAALLVVCAGTAEYFVLGEFLPPPFIVAALLGALSFAAGRWSRPIGWLALVLSLLIPIGALAGYLRGDLILAVPIFDALVFGWLFWNALPVAMASGPVPA